MWFCWWYRDNRVVHSSHFRLIFSSFSVFSFHSFLKNELQNETRMNRKIEPYPRFYKNGHFHFHFHFTFSSCFRGPLQCLIAGTSNLHHHHWCRHALPFSNLYHHQLRHHLPSPLWHHFHACKSHSWPQMTHFGNVSPNDGLPLVVCALGYVFFVRFFLL